MKNEDRIVELLAESLRNQDIQSEKLEHLAEVMTSQGGKLDHLTDVVASQGGKLDHLTDVVASQGGKLDGLTDVVRDVVFALQHQSGLVEKQSLLLEKLIQKYDKIEELEHRISVIEKKLEKDS